MKPRHAKHQFQPDIAKAMLVPHNCVNMRKHYATLKPSGRCRLHTDCCTLVNLARINRVCLLQASTLVIMQNYRWWTIGRRSLRVRLKRHQIGPLNPYGAATERTKIAQTSNRSDTYPILGNPSFQAGPSVEGSTQSFIEISTWCSVHLNHHDYTTTSSLGG